MSILQLESCLSEYHENDDQRAKETTLFFIYALYNIHILCMYVYETQYLNAITYYTVCVTAGKGHPSLYQSQICRNKTELRSRLLSHDINDIA